jgi:hypothetical protein
MEERENEGEVKWTRIQEPALAHAYIYKSILFYSLLYVLTIELTINDMAISYSHQLAILLSLL